MSKAKTSMSKAKRTPVLVPIAGRVSSREHRADLEIACPVKTCAAPIGEECRGDRITPGVVHFGRRVRAAANPERLSRGGR